MNEIRKCCFIKRFDKVKSVTLREICGLTVRSVSSSGVRAKGLLYNREFNQWRRKQKVNKNTTPKYNLALSKVFQYLAIILSCERWSIYMGELSCSWMGVNVTIKKWMFRCFMLGLSSELKLGDFTLWFFGAKKCTEISSARATWEFFFS